MSRRYDESDGTISERRKDLVTDKIHALLEGFKDQTTERERRRWRPLYRLLRRKEQRLRKDCTELPDKGKRLDARAQYVLIKELLAKAPSLETVPLRLRAPRKRRASPKN